MQQNEFFELGLKQAQLFTAFNLAYCELLIDGRARREILLCCYRCLVRTKKMKPIDGLMPEEKEKAWEVAKEFAKGRLGRKDLIEVVQALFTIEYFLNL